MLLPDWNSSNGFVVRVINVRLGWCRFVGETTVVAAVQRGIIGGHSVTGFRFIRWRNLNIFFIKFVLIFKEVEDLPVCCYNSHWLASICASRRYSSDRFRSWSSSMSSFAICYWRGCCCCYYYWIHLLTDRRQALPVLALGLAEWAAVLASVLHRMRHHSRRVDIAWTDDTLWCHRTYEWAKHPHDRLAVSEAEAPVHRWRCSPATSPEWSGVRRNGIVGPQPIADDRIDAADDDDFAVGAVAVAVVGSADCVSSSMVLPSCCGCPPVPVLCTRLGTSRTCEFADSHRIASPLHGRRPERFYLLPGNSADSRRTTDRRRDRAKWCADPIWELEYYMRTDVRANTVYIMIWCYTFHSWRCQIKFRLRPGHVSHRTVDHIANRSHVQTRCVNAACLANGRDYRSAIGFIVHVVIFNSVLSNCKKKQF